MEYKGFHTILQNKKSQYNVIFLEELTIWRTQSKSIPAKVALQCVLLLTLSK